VVGNPHEDAKATYNRTLAVLDEETRDGVSGQYQAANPL
jgi:hypothetical protein